MGLLSRPFAFKLTTLDVTNPLSLHYHVADTPADIPQNGLTIGDICVVLSTGQVFIADSSTTWAAKIAPGSIPIGTASTQVCCGNDSRLSDNRNPLPHTHGQYADITNFTNLNNNAVLTSDSRLSDLRNPLPHSHPQYADVTNTANSLANKVNTSDGRLFDNRNPLPHTHAQYADVTLFGTLNTNAVLTGDSRLSDLRNPLPHTHPQYADVTNTANSLANKVNTSDGRLSDNRNPLPHTHPQYADVTNTGIMLFTSIENSKSQRVFVPDLPVAGTFLLISATAYFVYLGRVLTPITPKFVELLVTTIGTGSQVAELGLFSTPLPPNKSNQSLTKLVSTGTIGALTSTGIVRNTSAFATQIAAGTHLWAGIRTAMVTTQPTLRALNDDWGEGCILALAGAGVLTGAGPFAGTIPAGATQITCPALRVTLD